MCINWDIFWKKITWQKSRKRATACVYMCQCCWDSRRQHFLLLLLSSMFAFLFLSLSFYRCSYGLLVARMRKDTNTFINTAYDPKKEKKREEKEAKRPKRRAEKKQSLKAFAIVCKILALQMALFAFLLAKFAHTCLRSCLTDLINTMYFNRPNLNSSTLKHITFIHIETNIDRSHERGFRAIQAFTF